MRQRPPRGDGVLLVPPAIEGASAGRSLLDDQTPTERPVLDELDRTVIELLLEDGHMSNRDLAKAAGTSNVTAGARVRRLVDHRVLIFTALIDWEAAGFDWFVIAKFNVEGRAPRDVAEDIAQIPECDAVALVFGGVDVLAYFLVRDRAELHVLIAEKLARVLGIHSMTMDLATSSMVTALGKRFFLARGAPPIRLPDPVVDLDELDTAIMQALLRDGRQSSRNIARLLNVSEGTVRARVQRIVSAGLMKVVAMVEPLALGVVGVIATIGLRVDRQQISTIADQISKLPGVLFVAVTVGSVDVSVSIAAEDQTQMLDVVLNQLRTLQGVKSTETLQMIDILRFSPYMKRLT